MTHQVLEEYNSLPVIQTGCHKTVPKLLNQYLTMVTVYRRLSHRRHCRLSNDIVRRRTCLRPRTDGAADPLVSFSVYRTCRLFVCVLRVLAVLELNATLIFSLIIIIITACANIQNIGSNGTGGPLGFRFDLKPIRLWIILGHYSALRAGFSIAN